jgi:hypothetical protein
MAETAMSRLRVETEQDGTLRIGLLFSVVVRLILLQFSGRTFQVLLWLLALSLISIGFSQVESRLSRQPQTLNRRADQNETHITLDQASVVRVYDVSDLINRWRSSRFLSVRDRSGLFSGHSGNSVFTASTAEELVDDLAWLIADQVAPGANSGANQSIWTVGSSVVALAQPDVHDKIAQVLRRLREADTEFP